MSNLGTHVHNELMYSVCQNRAAVSYSSLCFYVFLSFLFSNIESLSTFSPELCGIESYSLIQT